MDKMNAVAFTEYVEPKAARVDSDSLPYATTDLAERIDRMEKAITELAVRAESLMRPADPRADRMAEDFPEIPENSAPAVTRLRNLASQVSALTARVEDVSNRLCV